MNRYNIGYFRLINGLGVWGRVRLGFVIRKIRGIGRLVLIGMRMDRMSGLRFWRRLRCWGIGLGCKIEFVLNAKN